MMLQLTFENLNAKMKPFYVLSLCLALSILVGSLHAEDCCKDGETQPAEDCTEYLFCCSGKFVLKSCDDGDYWNATQGRCELDEGQCNGQNEQCREGELEVNPSDCAGYLECVNDVWVIKDCPDGLYFNETRLECVIDSDGVCLNCTEGCTRPDIDDCTQYLVCSNGKYVTKSCDDGDYWNADKRQCELDEGQCNNNNSTCSDGDINVNPSDCAGYLQCEDGKWVNISCADGAYYNQDLKACQPDENGVCLDCINNSTKSDEKDCTQYQICINGKYVTKKCVEGTYWNGNNSRCEIDNGECNGNGNNTCSDGQLDVNPSDCAGYLQCEDGKWVNISCADGAYYNQDLKACQPDENGVCLDCINNSTKSDEKDCTQYQICINGKYVTKKCVEGTYWNGNNSRCEIDNGECNGNGNNTNCTEGDTKVNPADCAGYLLCASNKWVAKKCPDLTYFNVSQCVYDYDGVCLNKTCDPECCDLPDNWMGPVADNCSAFIQCVNGFKYEQNCPNNLQYNNETKSCDFPENVECDDGSPPPSGPSAGPSGTYCESHGRCVGQRDGAMFSGTANDACSKSYVVCQCECEVEVPCPGGLVYNQQIKSCDYPANVNC